MDYQIVKAKKAASLAMRKANKEAKNSPEVFQKKRYVMREYRKMLNVKKASKTKIDEDFSKYLEWAILATIGLAVLSVSHPQVGILAIIFSILIVAAIIDTKIKASNEKNQKESEERMERLVRLVQNEKQAPAIETVPQKKKIKSITDYTVVKLEAPQETIKEFPYKGLAQ